MRHVFLPAIAAAVFATVALASPASAEGLVWSAVSAENTPESAFSAASDGEPVRVCRIRHRRDMEVGTVRDFFCQIGGDGMSRPYSIYELLVEAPGTAWAKAEAGALPAEALPVNDEHGPTIYACRTVYEGQTLVGLVRDSVCSAGYGPSELRAEEFDVLVKAMQ